MTVAAAFNVLQGLVIVADSRISYEGRPEKRDFAQKLYPLSEYIVAGIAGDCALANDLLFYLRKNIADDDRLKNIELLGIEAKKVFDYYYRAITSKHNLDNPVVQILIAGLNLSESKTMASDDLWRFIKAQQGGFSMPAEFTNAIKNQKGDELPFTYPKAYIYKYSYPSCQMVSTSKFPDSIIIGTGSIIESEMRDLNELMLPKLGDQMTICAIMLGNDLMESCFEKQIDSVGGMPHGYTITASGVSAFCLSTGGVIGNDGLPVRQAEMIYEDGKWIMHNKISGNKVPLKTLYDVLCDRDIKDERFEHPLENIEEQIKEIDAKMMRKDNFKSKDIAEESGG